MQCGNHLIVGFCGKIEINANRTSGELGILKVVEKIFRGNTL